MARLPDFMTFTGIDAWTDLDRVEDLSRRYPIEWGILFSPKRQGVDPRYPSLFHAGLITHQIGNLHLAAHLCGGHARDVLEKGRCSTLTPWIDCVFGRFQINTSDPADPHRVAEFADNHGGTGILQCQGLFPNTCEVDWLQDGSGGRGVHPDGWLSPEEGGPFVGYAGGLGPDTIATALPAIQATIPPNTPYWIDMESGIRTDDRLDLDKCEAVCRAVYGDSQ